MRPVWDVAAARAADRAAQQEVSEATLIDRAATAVARHVAGVLDRVYGRRVVVVAGKGHNGADALWAGHKLRTRGAQVDVVLVQGDPADDHGRAPLALLRAAGASIVLPDVSSDLLAEADVVIDGVLGVGASLDRGLPWPGLGDVLTGSGAMVVAVDVPSGVDATTGRAAVGAVRADVTVTFGAAKVGLLVDPGREHTGLLAVEDIGLGARHEGVAGIVDADDVRPFFLLPTADASKYTRGVVGVVAGGHEYVGATVLAVHGALRAGAGMVRLHSAPVPADAARRAHPEVVATAHDQWDADAVAADAKVDAWVIGPGLGTDDDVRKVLQAVLATDRPVIVDADAITMVATEPDLLRREAPTVVTPHVGEFRRLAPDIDTQADRLGAARAAAQRLGCQVLLKGRTTVVATPSGEVRLSLTGTSALATAGTGDVLSGMIGALLARSVGGLDAAGAAAWLHGLAGRLAAGDRAAPIVASDVAERLPDAIRALGG